MSEQHGAADGPGRQVIERLTSEDAPPEEWRREAMSRYAEARLEECGRILEASVDPERSVVRSATGPEQLNNMCLLAELYLSQALSPEGGSDDTKEQLLAKAKSLLDRVDGLDLALGQTSGIESFIAKAFHAIARHVLESGRQGDDLRRAEILFDSALKIDGASPKALLGKAVVLAQQKEWGQALAKIRQVLKRAAPRAPRSGLRLQCLKQLRFAMAACFCDLGRFSQTRNALVAALSADPNDVESLCALAHLEAKTAKDGVGKSLDYLGDAAKANQSHPIVLCHLANHAFYCGLEQPGGVPEGEQAPWDLASELLQRALRSTRSSTVKAEVHYQLGRLEHAKGVYDEALQEYNKCFELQPDHHACAYGFAQTCIQQEAYGKAIEALEHVRKASGKASEVLPQVLKLLTFAYLKVGDKAEEAAKCAEALCAADKDDMEAWAMRTEAQDQLAAAQPNATAQKVGMEVYEQFAKLLEAAKGASQEVATPQMWNNLGTLRSLQGDPDGAKEAFRRGMELAESQLEGGIAGGGKGPAKLEEAKDLHVARLTMRFNAAWLAESEGDHPDFMQATQDYMAINEEHNWHVDSLLQLGAQWQRMGETEIALNRYQEAMRSNPVLATLMQAELYRQRGEYSSALQSAELAVRAAGDKHFHYVHVYLGNLYYEAATAPNTRARDRDTHMYKALHSFIKALAHKKDSHYAANGVGMVFARRGKLDFARRTFQSVIQHHAQSGDPCALINLGHTYLQAGGESVHKAIALYHRARKLKPDDLSIRLYLAKAHFKIKEFDRCIAVLSDATQIWPDDLLLRYNLALALENYGVHLVSEERKVRRVIGVDNGTMQMNHAVQLLSSASRLFDYVYKNWSDLSESERKRISASSGLAETLSDELFSANAHKTYCGDIQTKAQEELAHLQARRAEMERRVQENTAQKEMEQQRERERLQLQAVNQQDEEEEANDRARDLEEKAKSIDLGKNLEAKVIAKAPKPKEPKPANQDTAPGGAEGEEELVPIADGSVADEAVAKEGVEEPRKKRGGGGKHRKQGKKEKKEGRRRKKDKKRRREGEEEEPALPEVAADGEEDPSKVLEKVEQAGGEGGVEDDGDSDAGGKKEKKHRKKRKKHSKKDKKEKKRRRTGDAEGGEAGSDVGEELFERAEANPVDDQAMEEELFGSDGED